MMKKYILFFTAIIFLSIGVFFVFSKHVDAAYYSIDKVCKNTAGNSTSNCGTACKQLCDKTDFTFKTTIVSEFGNSAWNGVKSFCKSRMGTTGSYKNYNATAYLTISYVYGFPATYTYGTYAVYAAAVCSTADKCSASTCANSGSTLRLGYCSCAVGGNYKQCCKKEGSTYKTVKAQKYYGSSNDDMLPDEGVCGSGMSIFYCGSYGCKCPVPVTVKLYLNGDQSLTSTTLKPGDPLTLNWSSGNADKCVSSNFATSNKASGSIGVNTGSFTERAEPYVYTVTCSRFYDQKTYGNGVTMTASAQVEVYSGQVPTCRANITASPSRIAEGDSSTLDWSSTEASGCSLNSETVSTSGSRTVSPAATTTYALRCDSSDGSGACQKSATITVGEPGVCPYYTGPTAVDAGLTVSGAGAGSCLPGGESARLTINWSGANMNKCNEIIGGGTPNNDNITCKGNWGLDRSGTGSLSDSDSVAPKSGVYTLTCTRPDYTCTNTNSFGNQSSCEASCNALKESYPAIETCSCAGGNQTVQSEMICSSTASASSAEFNYLEAPRFTTNGLVTEPAGRTQILLNQSVVLAWSVANPEGGTTLSCYPSVSPGDGTGWTDQPQPFGAEGRKTVSPKVSTTYLLTCRNVSAEDPSCFNETTAEYTIKVFTPDLQEIPAYQSGFLKMFGKILEGMKGFKLN